MAQVLMVQAKSRAEEAAQGRFLGGAAALAGLILAVLFRRDNGARHHFPDRTYYAPMNRLATQKAGDTGGRNRRPPAR